MPKLVEGFKKYKAHIKSEWITIDNDVIITAETEKALLVKEKVLKDEEVYSTQPFWIPKSRLKEIEKYDNTLRTVAERRTVITRKDGRGSVYEIITSVEKSALYPSSGFIVKNIKDNKPSLLSFDRVDEWEINYF